MKSPVGDYWTELWRSGWYASLGFGSAYELSGRRAIHTGVDLVRGDKKHEGAPVYAARGGVVTYAGRVPKSTWGNLVVIKHNEMQFTRYAHLKKIAVRRGAHVAEGEVIGWIGDSGMPGLPHLHFDIGTSNVFERNPTYWAWDDETAVRTNFANPTSVVLAVDVSKPPVARRVNVGKGKFLNVRREPSLKGQIVGKLPDGAIINVHPSDSAWVRIAGAEEYVYQEFLEPAIKQPVFIVPSMQVGLNIDFRNPGGVPDASLIKQFGLARFPLKAQQSSPSECANFYRPHLEALLNSGVECLLVLTHETWGEGRGFDWNNMDAGRWQAFVLGYVNYLRDLLRDLPRNPNVWYQIGNEHDQASASAVYMPPRVYATFLDACLEVLEEYGVGGQTISHGHASGKPAYWNEVALASRKHDMLRGIAVHPYGISGTPGESYGFFGTVEQVCKGWNAVTRKPLWFTEFGICNGTAQAQPPEIVGNYISNFLAAATAHNVKAAIWYAYSDAMDGCYGVVDNRMAVKLPVLSALLQWNRYRSI